MKSLETLVEVPEELKGIYSSLEELKAELAIVAPNSERNDVLMGKIFEKLTTAEAEEVKKEITEIAVAMNDLMKKRFGEPTPEAITGLIVFSDLLHEYCEPPALSSEQFHVLVDSGAFDELMTGTGK